MIFSIWRDWEGYVERGMPGGSVCAYENSSNIF